MNALAVAWKLRADMLTILAAASPSHRPPDSQSQVIRVGRYRRHRAKPDPFAFGSSPRKSESAFDNAAEQAPLDGPNITLC
jgi:hypothetical protein